MLFRLDTFKVFFAESTVTMIDINCEKKVFGDGEWSLQVPKIKVEIIHLINMKNTPERVLGKY